MGQELTIKNVNKSFEVNGEKINVLNDINLDIYRGEIFGIIGLSGAGKSTLVRCINMLEVPTSGQVLFEGENLAAMSEAGRRMARQSMGMIFQQFNLLAQRNVLQNVCFPMEIAHMDSRKAKERAKELLKLVGLEERMNAYPAQLSGGQKQRTALARTMVMKPKILLLDEPLSALDGVIKESIKAKIKEIAREFQLTTIIVTHDPEEALTLSDKVLIVNRGGIAQFGRPEEIIEHPADSFVKEFILNQLEIKKNNIFTLFRQEQNPAFMMQAV